MLKDSIKDSQHLASLLSNARYKIGASQEFMAMGLGVSKNTIYNWEKGTSQPSIKQFITWYELLGLNPTPYILQYCNQDEQYDSSKNSNDEEITKSLNKTIESLSTNCKQQLLYLLIGDHGSDPEAFLQMITANLHTPMRSRVNIARTIIDNYEIYDRREELIDTSSVMPDMDKLKKAVELGKEAAINRELGYSLFKIKN